MSGNKKSIEKDRYFDFGIYPFCGHNKITEYVLIPHKCYQAQNHLQEKYLRSDDSFWIIPKADESNNDNYRHVSDSSELLLSVLHHEISFQFS